MVSNLLVPVILFPFQPWYAIAPAQHLESGLRFLHSLGLEEKFELVSQIVFHEAPELCMVMPMHARYSQYCKGHHQNTLWQ